MKLFVLASALLLATSSAHLCLMSPPQIAGNISGQVVSGWDACLQLSGPCGGAPTSSPLTTLWGVSQTVEVLLLKDLDHWNAQAPGSLSLSWSTDLTTFTEIWSTPDFQSATPLIVPARINVAALPQGPGFLQAKYTTNNPAAPAVFYQCSHVNIVSA